MLCFDEAMKSAVERRLTVEQAARRDGGNSDAEDTAEAATAARRPHRSRPSTAALAPARASAGSRFTAAIAGRRGRRDLAGAVPARLAPADEIPRHLHVRFTNVPSPARCWRSSSARCTIRNSCMHVLLSCRRILFGFMLAAVVAVPLGLIMGRFRLAREMIFPVTEVLRPIPAIAWVPMSIMLWPSNEESIVFITFLGSFFPILINTMHGMSLVDPVLVRAAQCLGAREASIFREVYFPATLPHIFTGLTVGMGVAWVSLIAAEMISGQFGIGYFTWEAYSLVQYADIALGMICIGVLGLGSSALIRGIGKLAMPWRRA